MGYVMGDPPQDQSIEALWQYVVDEYRKLQECSQEVSTQLELFEYNTVPDKVYDGLIVRADGTNWNPGSGAGVYCYYGGSWNYLG